MANPTGDGRRLRTILEDLERDLDGILQGLRKTGGLPEVESLLRQARKVVAREAESPRLTVAVVGASTDRAKYGNKAVRAFRNAGFAVFPIHPTADNVEGLPAFASLDDLPLDILDRISLYVPPAVGLHVLDQAARKQVGEVWLNPGADAPEVVAHAEALGLNVVQACSILAVGEHPGLL